MSLRLRLTLIIAIVAGAAISLVAWFSYASTATEARSDVDDLLLERARLSNRILGPGAAMLDLLDEIPFEFGDRETMRGFVQFDTVVQVIEPDGTIVPIFGEVLLPAPSTSVDDLPSGSGYLEDVTVDGTHFRMISSAGPNGVVVQTAKDVTETDRILAGLRIRLLLIGAAGTVLAAIGAWFVARRALSPVERLTRAAENVAKTGSLESRIAETGSDEVGRLAVSFNTMLEALAASKVQQRRLVDDAGHELRTPLTSLRTNLEVLARRDDMSDADRADLMADVSYEIEQLSGLVREIVELAGDTGSDEEPATEADFGEIVRGVVERAERRTGREHRILGTGGRVMIRPRRVERALANLLDNADRWSPPGAAIEVRLDGGRVEVLDRGAGIGTADADRVFDRFFRGDAARTKPGSGLGLAIVKAVAAEHGGTVWAADRPEGGAAVGFEIPVSGEH